MTKGQRYRRGRPAAETPEEHWELVELAARRAVSEGRKEAYWRRLELKFKGARNRLIGQTESGHQSTTPGPQSVRFESSWRPKAQTGSLCHQREVQCKASAPTETRKRLQRKATHRLMQHFDKIETRTKRS